MTMTVSARRAEHPDGIGTSASGHVGEARAQVAVAITHPAEAHTTSTGDEASTLHAATDQVRGSTALDTKGGGDHGPIAGTAVLLGLKAGQSTSVVSTTAVTAQRMWWTTLQMH